MKIATILGARPQFIKAAMVSRAIANHNRYVSCGSVRISNFEGTSLGPQAPFPVHNSSAAKASLPLANHQSLITEVIIHTGQHYDFNMSDIFFQELKLPEPDYNFGIGSATHGEQTGKMLIEIERVLIKDKPDVVVVYGDTNSTLAGALAASKLHIPVAHVEAGLRSYNMKMPEEINRVLTDHCSTILFCPTKAAVENLRKEGFTNIIDTPSPPTSPKAPNTPNATNATNAKLVLNVGDVMYDLILYALPLAENTDILSRLSLTPKDYLVLTLHRAENADDPERLKELLGFASQVSSKKIIFPVHPRTKNTLDGLPSIPENIILIEPIGYLEMIKLMRYSSMVLTDSGGVQKEAFWLRVPCITLREETEWVETVASGWNILYKDYKGSHNPSPTVTDLFGDGKSAERIIQTLMRSLMDNE